STMQTAARNRSWGGGFPTPTLPTMGGCGGGVGLVSASLANFKKKPRLAFFKIRFSQKILAANPICPVRAIFNANITNPQQKDTPVAAFATTTKTVN
ncbi:hypothetical protein ACVGW7_20860, partial [Enterobacter intestinihominis]